MRVPSAAAIYKVTIHGLVAWEHVLENARQNMMNARLTVRGRGTLKEDIRWAIFTFIR